MNTAVFVMWGMRAVAGEEINSPKSRLGRIGIVVVGIGDSPVSVSYYLTETDFAIAVQSGR
jgi:hypothetical protein